MFCSVKTDEGNDEVVISLSLSGHLTYIFISPQASSQQIHVAPFSSQ